MLTKSQSAMLDAGLDGSSRSSGKRVVACRAGEGGRTGGGLVGVGAEGCVW